MASRKNRRGLSSDDLEVWKQVAKTVQPMVASRFPVVLPNQKPIEKIPQNQPIEAFEISSRRQATVSISLTSHPTDALRAAPLQMDRKNYDRMKKGKMVPDRRVDLHGMTADVAHGVLINFVMSARSGGARLVLVITGKGRSGSASDTVMPDRKGIIRRSVPEWLRQAPLRDLVVQVIPAHRKHGGDGAYYVYLRRQR